MTRKRITAGELMAKLNADPQFVAAREREDAERQQRKASHRIAEAPLVEELRAAGFDVESAWDLVNTPGSYPTAVPILLAHLPRPYPPPVREGIARALAVPETKAAGWTLVTRMFQEEPAERAKDGLAVAISASADDDVIDDVIALARDRRNGPSRLLLLRALERSTVPRARATPPNSPSASAPTPTSACSTPAGSVAPWSCRPARSQRAR